MFTAKRIQSIYLMAALIEKWNFADSCVDVLIPMYIYYIAGRNRIYFERVTHLLQPMFPSFGQKL